MPRLARLPDGTTLQFPDGTPDEVIDGAVQQHLAEAQIPKPEEVARQEDVQIETAKVQTLADLGARLASLQQAQIGIGQALGQLARLSLQTNNAIGALQQTVAAVGQQVVAVMSAPKRVTLADGTSGSIAPDVSN